MSLKLAVGLAVLVVIGAVAAAGPWLPLPDPWQADPGNASGPPSTEHLLGTDFMGRDYLSRLIEGTGWSFVAGGIGAALAIAAGWPLGLLARIMPGWFGRLIAVAAHILVVAPSFLLERQWSSRMLMLFCVGVLPVAWLQFLCIPVFGTFGELMPVAWGLLMAPVAAYALRKDAATAVRPVAALAATLFAWSVVAQVKWDMIGLGLMPPAATWGDIMPKDILFYGPPPAFFVLLATAAVVLGAAFLVADGLAGQRPSVRPSLAPAAAGAT